MTLEFNVFPSEFLPSKVIIDIVTATYSQYGIGIVRLSDKMITLKCSLPEHAFAIGFILGSYETKTRLSNTGGN